MKAKLLLAALIAAGAAIARADDAAKPAPAKPGPIMPKVPLVGPPSADDIRIARISTHCYAAVSTNGASNAGFIVGKDRVLVIDTLGSPVRTEKLVSLIATITSAPIGALVLTHWHYDHVVGDQKLPAGIPIYAHAKSSAKLAERLKKDTVLLGPGSGFHATVGITDVRLPDHPVERETVIELGDLTVAIAPVSARNATHSVGDLIAWVGSERVLYVGDLVSNGYLPNLADSETFAWIDVLARLRGVPAQSVVPGHGAVGGPEILATQLDYLMTLRRYVKHVAKEKGTEEDAVKNLPIPDAYAKLGFAEWWPDNVRFVFREVSASR